MNLVNLLGSTAHSVYSPSIGSMTAAERQQGRYMRAPDHPTGDIDITADLTGGADDAALADPAPQHGAVDGTQTALPPGVQPAHGQDVKKVHEAPKADKPEPSLREQLTGAFKGPEGQPTDQQQAQSAQPPEQQQAPPPALTKDAEGKYRQADGTFASAEQISAYEAAQLPPQQQQEQAPVLHGLTPIEQQQFQSLPAELRQLVVRTMEGLNTRGARYGEYDLLEQHLIGPRREAWAAQGMNPAAAVSNLFALSDFASTRPGDFVLWFADQNKIDLDALLDARDAQEPVDPAVRQIQGTVQQLQGTLQQFQQGQAEVAQQARLAEIQTFATEQEAGGTLKRPYLTDVMDGWAAQIGALRTANPTMPNAEVLQRAYEAACWADPGVRGKMQQAADTQRKQQEQQRVAIARQAGSSITGAPAGDVGTVPDNANRTLRQELEQQFAAQSA